METENNATAHHVPGLQPFTTYMFRVAARNALGFSKPSRESYPTMTHRERKYDLRKSSNFTLIHTLRKSEQMRCDSEISLCPSPFRSNLNKIPSIQLALLLFLLLKRPFVKMSFLIFV